MSSASSAELNRTRTLTRSPGVRKISRVLTASVLALGILLTQAPRRIAVDVEVAPERPDSDTESIALAEDLEKKVIAYLLSTELVHSQIKLRGCGSDLACAVARMKSADVDFALAVVVNRSVTPALSTIRLIDVEHGAVVSQHLDELGGDTASSMRSRAGELFQQAGFESGGRLIVDPAPSDAKILIEGVPHRGGEVFVLPPGTVHVAAEREDYDSSAAVAEVHRGEDTHLALELTKSASLVESPVLWIIVGVAAVAGVGLAFALRSAPRDEVDIMVYH